MALPAYLTGQLARPLPDAGVSIDQVDALGAAMAGKGHWKPACSWPAAAMSSGPRRALVTRAHRVALEWLLETARNAEIGAVGPGGSAALPGSHRR